MNHRIYYRKPLPMTPDERREAQEPRMTPAECREVVARAIAMGELKHAPKRTEDPK